jgi:hypothetical protein
MIHPVLLELLAAEHVRDMIATAEKASRRQQARQARQRRTSPDGPALHVAPRIDPQANVTTRPDHDRSGRDEDHLTPRRDQSNAPVLVMQGRAPSDPRHG